MRTTSRTIAAVAVSLCAVSAAFADCITPQWAAATSAQSNYALKIKLGDFDGDGRSEVAAMIQTAVYTATIDTHGVATNPVTVLASARYLDGIAVGDFTGDGKLDILVSDRDARQLIVIKGNGDGTFAADPITTDLPEFPHSLVVGDFNGDGKLDAAIAANDVESVIILSGDGTGHFSETSRSAVEPASLAMTAADVDNDGAMDIVVGHEFSTVIDVLFGLGNGSFASSLKVTGRNNPSAVVAADLDGDGDKELIFANGSDNSISVNMNFGGRTFGSAVRFPTSVYSPYDLVVADVTMDGNPDVIVSTTNGYLITVRGNGTGSLIDASYSYIGTALQAIASLDFNGDGRPDLVVGRDAYGAFTTARNQCGDSTVSLNATPPVTTVGQRFTATVNVGGYGANYAGGTVDIKSGSLTLGSATVVNGHATIAIDNAPVGDHSLIAHYSGDAEYEPNTSAAVSERVTTETTTTTLTKSKAQTEFGESLTVTATVTSSTGTTPKASGYIYLTLDSTESSYPGSAPVSTSTYTPEVGTHTLDARYTGDATYPASVAAQITHVVVKSTPAMQTQYVPVASSVGDTVSVEVDVNPKFYNSRYPTGQATLFDGTTVIGTFIITTYGSGRAQFSMTNLAVGRHYLTAKYDGDASYNPATSVVFVHTVFPAGATFLDARGDATAIRVAWSPNASSSDYLMRRPLGPGYWSYQGSAYSASYIDTYASAGVPYLYQLQGFQGQALSNIDLGMRVSFTEDPLTPGTPVRAVHLGEIIAALNVVRNAAALASFNPSNLDAGDSASVSQIIGIRGSINEVRSVLGVPAFAFTDDLVAGVTPIRASYIQELREAIR
jgi:hypothetical protein